MPTDPDAYALDLIHSLAQYAHCLAQGKVGSGFDVASAVYGTHVYRRFSPSLLTPLMRDRYTSIKPDSGLIPALKPEKWDQGAEPFRLPKGLRLMLADVDAGTDTPSFVGRVLAWREREKETAAELFTDLGSANDTLGRLLKDLSSLEDDPQYAEVLQLAARTRVEEVSEKMMWLVHDLECIARYRQTRITAPCSHTCVTRRPSLSTCPGYGSS